MVYYHVLSATQCALAIQCLCWGAPVAFKRWSPFGGKPILPRTAPLLLIHAPPATQCMLAICFCERGDVSVGGSECDATAASPILTWRASVKGNRS